MDLIIDGLEARKNGEKYHDFVLDDAINSIKRAKEALDEGMKDPEAWWTESLLTTKTFMTLFPFIYMVQQHLSHIDPQTAEENSQEEPSKDQGVEDISGIE
jgi:hypothetical protein